MEVGVNTRRDFKQKFNGNWMSICNDTKVKY